MVNIPNNNDEYKQIINYISNTVLKFFLELYDYKTDFVDKITKNNIVSFTINHNHISTIYCIENIVCKSYHFSFAIWKDNGVYKMLVKYQINWLIYFENNHNTELYSLSNENYDILKISFWNYLFNGYKTYFDSIIKTIINNSILCPENKLEFANFINAFNKYEHMPTFNNDIKYFLIEYCSSYININNKYIYGLLLRIDKVDKSNMCTINVFVYYDDESKCFKNITGIYEKNASLHTYESYYFDTKNNINMVNKTNNFYRNLFIHKRIKF